MGHRLYNCFSGDQPVLTFLGSSNLANAQPWGGRFNLSKNTFFQELIVLNIFHLFYYTHTYIVIFISFKLDATVVFY